MSVKIDQLLMTADFKDIDFLYFLNLRYANAIYPSLALMSGT